MKIFGYAAAALTASSVAFAYNTGGYGGGYGGNDYGGGYNNHNDGACLDCKQDVCEAVSYVTVPDYPVDRPVCACHGGDVVIKVTGQGTTQSVGLDGSASGRAQFRIEEPMVLDTSGNVCGTYSALFTFPTTAECQNIDDPACPVGKQIMQADVMCLDACNNKVWWSGKLTHQSSDPRLTLLQNAQMQAAARLGRTSIVSSFIDGTPDSRDLISAFNYGAYEGLDNVVMPIGATGYSYGDFFVSYDGRDLCKLRDQVWTAKYAAFKLICTSDCADDCALPLTDYNSPNGLYMPDFRRFVQHTAIQWLDAQGNCYGEPVCNSVENLLNPPECIMVSDPVVHRDFTCGDISLTNNGPNDNCCAPNPPPYGGSLPEYTPNPYENDGYGSCY